MTEIKIKPLQDRVVILPIEEERKTSAGIIIPDNIKDKPQAGTVIAVGSGKKDEAMELKVGDKVLFSKYAGTEFKHNEETYLIMRQGDVLAII